jgi:hypothetical protein
VLSRVSLPSACGGHRNSEAPTPPLSHHLHAQACRPRSLRLRGGWILTTDQHAALLLKIGDGGTFGEELGIGEHREAGADASAGLDLGGGEDRLYGYGGAHRQGDRAWAATVRRPRLLVGVFTVMNTMSAEAIADSTAVETGSWLRSGAFQAAMRSVIGMNSSLSQQGVVPAERDGAAVPLGSWRRRRPHELQP